MMTEHLIDFAIAESGQRFYRLNPKEAVEMIQKHSVSGNWIYADNQLVESDWDGWDEATLSTISCVRILPALVGGPTYSPHKGEEE